MGFNRPTGIKSNWILIPNVLLSLATGALGIVVYIREDSQLRHRALLAIVSGELLTVLLLPFCVLGETPAGDIFTFIIAISSSLASLGAGLSYFIAFMHQIPLGINFVSPKIFKSFICLFLASLMALGIQLGQCLQPDVYEDVTPDQHSLMELEDIGDYKSSAQGKLKDKFVSLKASAQTLVEKRSQRLEDHVPTYQSQVSTMNSKDTSNTVINRPINNMQQYSSYNIKKLSVISQSTSSMSLSKRASLPENINGTPMLIKTARPNKNVMLERDAIKRIPSVLLPPHLRAFDELDINHVHYFDTDAGQQPQGKLKAPFQFRSSSATAQDMIFKSRSQGNLNSEIIQEEFIQQIPRAATLHDIWPVMHERPQGMRTISLEEWEKNQIRFKAHQVRGISDSYRPFQQIQPPISENFGEPLIAPQSPQLTHLPHERDTLQQTITDDESLISMITSDRQSISVPESPERQEDTENSTEEALKIVEGAQEKTMKNDDLLKSAIDLTQSTLHLEDIELTQLTMQKTKSRSPQKSIFKGHSNMSSVSSFNFKPQSVPTSPRKKSLRLSPKKRGFKNLSLSSIVFKDEDDDIPNFSYVHELQTSPSKKRASVDNMHHYSNSDIQRTSTPTKTNATLDLLRGEENKKTPDSSWSSGSKNSVFPSEVIGEYDKEKWKTLERLNMVEHI